MAQVWLLPALMAVNVPAGAFNWPRLLSPQHVRRPMVSSAHVCDAPAASATNVPGDAVDCPWLLSPQQVVVSAVVRAHA
jgi:hypothetical protein